MHRIEGQNFIKDNEGRSIFTDGPPGTTVPAAWLNSIQEEIARFIENAGLSLYNAGNDQYGQLSAAINRAYAYDHIVNSQQTFNDIVERVGANQYRIKGAYRSVFLKYSTGGYAMAGGNSPLSGGDAWGYLETNACTLLSSEPGAYLNFANTQGYLEVNTDDCVLESVDIRGTASVASAISQSFLLNAHRVIFRGCKTSNRLSNVDFAGFQGSGTALHNITSKYTDCCAYTLDGSDKLYGYKDCQNMSGCIGYDFDATNDHVYGFYNCNQISNCYATDIYQETALGIEDAYGFYGCARISNCYATDIESKANVYGFSTCKNISSCYAYDIDNIYNGNAYGFYNCNQISGCKVDDIESIGIDATGFHNCIQISACSVENLTTANGGNRARGFENCEQITSCKASDINSDSQESEGFQTCFQISGCFADLINSISGNASGFRNCKQISSCKATNITSGGSAFGFHSNNYGAALWTDAALNTNNAWIDTVDAQIVNKVSTPSVWT